MDVVSTHSCKELSLSISILPLLELPVLAVDENSDYSRPSRLRKVSHTVVDIEVDYLVAYASSESDQLAWVLKVRALLRGLLIIPILKESLHISQREIAGDEHGWHDYHWMKCHRKLICLPAAVTLEDGLEEVQALLRSEDLHIKVDFLGNGTSMLYSLLSAQKSN